MSLPDRDAALPRLNGFAFVLLPLFCALVPFPYGAVTPGATTVLEASAFIIAALTFLSIPRHTLGKAWLPVGCLALVACVGAIQLVPMPISTLHKMAPLSEGVYTNANQILALYGRPPVQSKVSIAPDDTRVTILQTLAYAALFAASALLATTRRRRRIVIGALLLSSALHVLYATATTGGDRLHGTFINPNHFAGYLQIALAFAFGVVWRELLHNRERGSGIRDLAQRVEKRAIPLVLPVLLFGLIAAGLALTRSRGGIIAAAITTIITVALAITHESKRSRSTTATIGAIIAVVAGGTFAAFLTGSGPLQRFLLSDAHDIGSDARISIWAGSLRVSRQSPILGSGLGSFREAFRRVQPRSIQGLVEQAHNDFLQMLVTGGWVGAALVTIAFASMLVLLVREWRRQDHREESAFALAGIGALIALILHGLVEFNMSIPAIPATLAVMMGIAWAAANARGELQTRSKPRLLPRNPS